MADLERYARGRTAHQMVKQRIPINEIVAETGLTRDWVLIQIARVWGKNAKYPGKREHNSTSDTLCWLCAKANCRCSWSRFFIPVDGWEAKKTRVKNGCGDDAFIESYKVINCPEFEQDPPRKRG